VVQDATQGSSPGEVSGGCSDVRVDSDGAVVSIVLNRPAKLNALTHAMIRAVRDAMAEAQREPEVRVILLRGEGRAFSVGDDLSDLSSAAAEPEHQGALVGILQDVTRQIMLGPKPVIAVVQGWAVGAAFSWVLNCDHAIYSRSTRSFFPELKWGVSPTGAATTLAPQMLGTAQARAAFQLLKRFSADELLSLGVVSQVVDDGAELSFALQCARDLATRAPEAVAGIKRLTQFPFLERLDDILSREAQLAVALSGRDAVSARIAAFQRGQES
jgi:enoyl-CoA hydratase/carnithine racemase